MVMVVVNICTMKRLIVKANRGACSLIFSFLLSGWAACFSEEPAIAPLQGPATVILLPMQIGDKASLMLLNTMAERSVIDNAKREPGMKAMGTARVHDFAGNAQESPLFEIPSMKFRSREWANVSAAMLDFHNFTIVTGVPIAGCLGVSEFRDSKLFIDYEVMKLTMHKGESLLKGPKVQELPLLPDTVVPSFKAVIDGVDVTFMVGTAQNNAISIETSVFDRFVEKGLIKKREGTGRSISLSKDLRTSRGTFTSGELMGKTLKGLRVHSDGSSLLGVRWLAGFRTEIDFPGKMLRFVPVAHERKVALAEEMLAAILGYSNGHAAIIAIKPGGKGAMEIAGLQEKDEIFSLAGAEYLTWHVVLGMLEKNAGKRIKATYKRPGVEGIRETEIQLPDMITEWDTGLEATDTPPKSAPKNEARPK